MKPKISRGLFAAIIVVAAILRFWQLSQNPPALTWDEAAWGYNAYAIGIDGRDEFGRFLPVDYLESFGDFKPPMYAYLTVIPVWLFGLNAFATRFASALFGVLSIGVVYGLVGELFSGKDEKEFSSFRKKSIALAAAALLAISPWHVNLSRAAFEANVASFFIMAGVWLFFRWIRLGNSKMAGIGLLLSTASLIASVYTFNTARVVAPALFILLAARFYRVLWKRRRVAVPVFLVGFILCLPFIRFMLTPMAQLRYREVNIFSDLDAVERTNATMQRDAQWWCSVRGNTGCDSGNLPAPLWSRLINNRRIAYSILYVKHYLDHFNPSFLFINGDGNPKFSTQDVGQLYLWELPFLVIGVFFLLRNRPGYWWILPVWLLIGIAPAAFARETPHALRIETTLPVWQVITAMGFVEFYAVLTASRVVKQRPRALNAIIFLIVLVLGGNVAYYLHGYYTHYPREYSREWQYGYEEAVSFAESHKEFDQVVFSTVLGRPYIYALFYSRTDPREFRKTAVVEREVYGFVHVRSFGRYQFSDSPASVYYPRTVRVVYFDLLSRLPTRASILQRFNLLNGETTLIAYQR